MPSSGPADAAKTDGHAVSSQALKKNGNGATGKQVTTFMPRERAASSTSVGRAGAKPQLQMSLRPRPGDAQKGKLSVPKDIEMK